MVPFGAVATAYALCTLPLAVHVLVRSIGGQDWVRPTFGTVSGAFYLLFFASGLTQYLQEGQTLTFAVVGRLPLEKILPAIFGTAVVTCAIVVGAAIFSTDARVPTAPSVASVAVTGDILTGLALTGAALTISSYGGVEAASTALLLHDRQTGLASAGQLGATLWAVFALPAASAAAASGLLAVRARRLVSIVEVAILLAVALVVFGSRLTFILTIVAVWFAYDRLKLKRVPVRYVIAVVVVFIASSALVLNSRAAVQNSVNQATIWDSLGYGIFDVTAATSTMRGSIAPMFSDPMRAVAVLSTALPGSGGRAAEISSNRLDVIVAQAIGNSVHAESTGLPPSLPTAIWIPFGIVIGSMVGVLIGAIVSAVQRALSRATGGLAFILVALFGAFAFNAFKGGDLLLDLGSEVSRWVYVVIVYYGVWIVVGRHAARSRERIPVNHEF